MSYVDIVCPDVQYRICTISHVKTYDIARHIAIIRYRMSDIRYHMLARIQIMIGVVKIDVIVPCTELSVLKVTVDII